MLKYLHNYPEMVYMAMPNSSIEDICALVGFTATVRLIDWHGGTNIYIPDAASEQHPLARLIGEPALRALCRDFGNETLWIPREKSEPKVAHKKRVAGVLLAGHGSRAAAAMLGMSERQVQRTRRELEQRGVLPEAPPPVELRRALLKNIPRKSAQGKGLEKFP